MPNPLIGTGRRDRFPKEDVRLRRGLASTSFVPFVGANMDVDLGAFSIIATRFFSTATTLSLLSPLVVSSTVRVDNLNVQYLDGHPFADFVTNVTGTAPIVSSGGQTPAISITPADATHAGSVPLSGTPVTNVYLRATVTTGAVSWQQIAYADISGTPTIPTQYWQRTGTTLSPVTAGDLVSGAALIASDPAQGLILGTDTLFRAKTTNLILGLCPHLPYSTMSGTGNLNFGGATYQWYQLTSGSSNTAIGAEALRNLTTGDSNVGIGVGAGLGITTGIGHVCIGGAAGTALTTGSKNIAIGGTSMFAATTPSFVVAIGNDAAYSVTTSYNVAVGNAALGITTGMSGGQEVCVGAFSGSSIASGDANVCIGYSANVAAAGTTRAVAVGMQAVAATDGIALGKGAVAAAATFKVPTAVTTVDFNSASLTIGAITSSGVATATFHQTSTAPTANSTGTVVIVAKDAAALTANAGWLPLKRSDGTTVYVPYWL